MTIEPAEKGRCERKYHARVLKSPSLTKAEMRYQGLDDDGFAVFVCLRCSERIVVGAPEPDAAKAAEEP